MTIFSAPLQSLWLTQVGSFPLWNLPNCRPTYDQPYVEPSQTEEQAISFSPRSCFLSTQRGLADGTAGGIIVPTGSVLVHQVSWTLTFECSPAQSRREIPRGL